MDHYADSSFLVSCYLADANTPKAKLQLSKIGVALPFTALHALEVRNAFKLGVFRRLITSAQAQLAWSELEADLHKGRLIRTAVKWQVAFRVASSLSERHSATNGARSLDILHVAAAKSLRVTHFISFDSRQSSLAARANLTVASAAGAS